jgi:hypothetical protein
MNQAERVALLPCRRNTEPLEIPQVSSHDRRVVNESRRRDQSVLDQIIRTAVHQARPPAKNCSIRRQDVLSDHHRIDPIPDRFRLRWILLARVSTPACSFPSVTAERKSCSAGVADIPSGYARVRSRTHFRNNVAGALRSIGLPIGIGVFSGATAADLRPDKNRRLHAGSDR